MAFQMVHMSIAYNLLQPLGIEEGREEFILGSVAPDAAPVIEPAKLEKIHVHLFEDCGPWGDTQDYDHWIRNIKAFWEKYGADEKDTRKKMLLLGICVHCLTDYWNDLLIWRTLQKQYIPPMTVDEFRADFYPEARDVDKWLFQNSENAEDIVRLLHDSHEMDIFDFVSAPELAHIKDHLINVQYNLPDPIDVSGYRYYPAEKVQWFVSEVTDRVKAQLDKDFA